MIDITMRPHKDEDKDFIFSSWLKSFVGLSLMTRGIPRKIAFNMQKKVVEACVDRASIIVATPNDDPDLILGYVVFERFKGEVICHYIYVKASYRRLGLAKTFLDIVRLGKAQPVITTHMTELGMNLKRENLIYNPYLLMTGEYYGSHSDRPREIRSIV